MENEDNESEIIRVSISKAGMQALNQIRGLHEKAQYLLICGERRDANGNFYLEGTEEEFDELSDDLTEEIMYGLSPKSRLPTLRAAHRRMDPENAEIYG